MLQSLLAPLLTVNLLLYPAPREPEGSDKGWGFLGVSYLDEVEGRSIRVTDVHEDTPAQRAGLQVGDLITGADGKPIPNTQEFTRTVVRTRPGTEVMLEVNRDGKTLKLKAKLGVRPESFPHPFPELEAPAPRPRR